MSDYTDKELISKKDLLARYGISYGALYRWKRKGLIPEEWFIKKSTVTGQETFFPVHPVCQRIELILEQKEDISLDELAHRLNKEEKSNAALVVHTIFGDKSFRMEDIKGISLDLDSKRVDMTEPMIALISEIDKKRS